MLRSEQALTKRYCFSTGKHVLGDRRKRSSELRISISTTPGRNSWQNERSVTRFAYAALSVFIKTSEGSLCG